MSAYGGTPAAWSTSTPDTRPACERDGHDFRQRRDADGAYTTWLYCRRCGKQRRIGAVPAQ